MFKGRKAQKRIAIIFARLIQGKKIYISEYLKEFNLSKDMLETDIKVLEKVLKESGYIDQLIYNDAKKYYELPHSNSLEDLKNKARLKN